MSYNRYIDAPKNVDYSVDQQWESYTAEEHKRWDRLYARQTEVLKGQACDVFLNAVDQLELSPSGIPDMTLLSDRLEKITGWRVVPVAGLVPDDVFFDHLANRRFPAGAFIRPEEQFDYLQEPDVFHDIFGHVPLLANPVFAKFMEAYGRGGQSALDKGQLHNLARLYWYTVEFGLLKTEQGLRIYGAGILSSGTESTFSLKDASANHIEFDLKRVMCTNYIINDFQQTYFVIDSFESLLKACYDDFSELYDVLKPLHDIEAHKVIKTDTVLQHGSLAYFKSKKYFK